MPTPFAINGLGRIGRALLRVAHERDDLQLVAINDRAPVEQVARLVARDSLHREFPAAVSDEDGDLVIDGKRIRAFQETDPGQIPWHETDAAIVVDATGRCLTRACAELHLKNGVRKVLVSANADEVDITICVGVNDDAYEPPNHNILSAASCTTNCLVPVLHTLDAAFGVEHALFNTVHSYNNDQSLLDYAHTDPRRARSATLNIIPTTTSAVGATIRVLPTFAGRLDGYAIRVPAPNVSLVDLAARLATTPTIDQVNAAFQEVAEGSLRGIVATTSEPLVSTDFLGDPHSAIVDLPLTQQVGGSLYRIVAWYDNEWGHASRLADLLERVGATL